MSDTSGSTQTIKLKIKGMSCVNCSNSIESYLKASGGVISVTVNFSTGEGRVTYDEKAIDVGKIIELIEEIGFGASVEQSGATVSAVAEKPALSPEIIIAVTFGVPVFALNMFLCDLSYAPILMLALSLPVVFYSGAGFHKKAYFTLKKRLPLTMDALVSASSLSSFILSVFLYLGRGTHELFFDSSTSIIAIILVGKTIEERIRSRARVNVGGIIEGMPSSCAVETDGKETEMPVYEIETGMTTVVKPHQKIPVDGEIVSGEGFVENSAITGESRPVYVKAGDRVWAGSQNFDSILKIRAATPGRGSYINQIESMLEAALSKKSGMQRTADYISSYFVPAVFLLALAAFSFHRFYALKSFEFSAIAAISTIAIACPCALGLALPVAFLFGTNLGARSGILFADPDALGKIGRIKSLVFDKTGTLTTNSLCVTEFSQAPGCGLTREEMLSLCGSVERYSDHPIARAVIEYISGLKIPFGLEVIDYKTHGGSGISAIVSGRRVAIGSDKITNAAAAFETVKHGGIVFYMSVDGAPTARFELTETLSEGAADTVKKLVSKNIKIYLLTGDRQESAAEISDRLGINRQNVHASMKPHEKANFISKLKEETPGSDVAMIGDGVNDALSMARADIAIAMADATSIARTAAAIILTRHGLKNVHTALELGEKMHRVITQNFFWAFFYNMILIPSAMIGKLDPMQASFAMIISSLFVVLNSTRLKRI